MMSSLKPAVLSGFALAVLLASVGCNRLTSQEGNIEQAIKDHLSQRGDLSMDQMVMELGEVKVDGEAAGAEVVFRTTSDPPARMSYHYELRRQDNTWKVTGGWPSGSDDQAGTQHPGMGAAAPPPALPEGHPPLPEENPPSNSPSP
jgi:hypothetical protein